MKLKNISRQKIKPWYYIHVTRKNANTNIESEDSKMTDTKKKELILSAGEFVKNGVRTEEIKNQNVVDMMKKIAANAVCIGLYNFNRFLISNIGDGEFNINKTEWRKAQDNLFRYLEIVDNDGENLDAILSTGEIEVVIDYTIFEQTGESAEDE